MPISIEQYLEHIERAAAGLAADAADAGLDAPVPTCPEWTVTDLVGHLGTVHRWATAIIAGALPSTDLSRDADVATEPPDDRAALAGWFRAGADGLLDALRAAPDDLAAAVFLHAAPPPKTFWARRQAHETTIHRIDAMSARLGRYPTTAEAGIAPGLAADGLDELLVGFVPRRSSRLRSADPLTMLIAPTDVEVAWTVAVSGDTPVTAPGADPDHPADVVLTGPAAALYLGLWNRGDEISQTGRVDALGLWRQMVRVSWA